MMNQRPEVTLRDVLALAPQATWDALEQTPGRGALTTMLASETVLAKDWNTPEEDAAWANWQDFILNETVAPQS